MKRARSSTPTGWSRTAIVLLVSSFVYGLSFRGLIVVLRQLYVLRLGYDPELYGLWSAMGPLGFTTFSLIAGWLGGRLGERRAMLVGGVGMALVLALMPLPQLWPQTRLVAPFISNLLVSAIWTLIYVNQIPALTRATTPEQRATGYSLLSALMGLGGFVGAYLAGVLPGWTARWWHLPDDGAAAYAAALWLAAGLTLLCALPTLWVRLDAPQRPAHEQARARLPGALVARTIALCVLAQAGVAALTMFGTAYLDSDLHLPAEWIGSINSAGRLLAMAAALATPWLTRRLGAGRGLLLITAAITVGLLPVVLSAGWVAAAFSVIVVFALDSAFRPVFSHYIMADVPETMRAQLSGINSVAYGLSFGAITYGGGYVVEAFGYRGLFGVGLIVTFAAILAFALAIARDRRHAPAQVD